MADDVGGAPGGPTRTLAIGAVVLGAAVILVGVLGAVAGWGSTTTVVDVSAAASATTTTTVPAGETDTSTTAPLATSTTVPGTTASTAPAAETPDAFLAQLGAALASGDVEFQVTRLAPAVIARYGEEQCRTQLATQTDPSAAFVVNSVGEYTTYDYITDGASTSVPEVVSVEVTRTANNAPASVTVHLARVDDELRWFTDCGTPTG